jgi:hypothetical protein
MTLGESTTNTDNSPPTSIPSSDNQSSLDHASQILNIVASAVVIVVLIGVVVGAICYRQKYCTKSGG